MPLKVNIKEEFVYKFSICTLVTSHEEYERMLQTFYNAGFTESDCEFLYVDNSEHNEFDAYSAFNRFLRIAKGEFVIICHQDILLNLDNRKKLEDQICHVSSIDPQWAVLGNAGINDMFNRAMIVTHSDGSVLRSGVLPSKVQSLDENFILIRSSANLAVSGDLMGFHLYGADVCLVAGGLGYSSYAIDFHLTHNGNGKMDESFEKIKNRFNQKYSLHFRNRYIRTMMTSTFISSNNLLRAIMQPALLKNIIRVYWKFKH